jgi:hypothetical protein
VNASAVTQKTFVPLHGLFITSAGQSPALSWWSSAIPRIGDSTGDALYLWSLGDPKERDPHAATHVQACPEAAGLDHAPPSEFGIAEGMFELARSLSLEPGDAPLFAFIVAGRTDKDLILRIPVRVFDSTAAQAILTSFLCAALAETVVAGVLRVAPDDDDQRRREVVKFVGELRSRLEAALRARTPSKRPGSRRPNVKAVAAFMQREQEVAALFAEGWSQRAIADELGISQSTVSRCLKNAAPALRSTRDAKDHPEFQSNPQRRGGGQHAKLAEGRRDERR